MKPIEYVPKPRQPARPTTVLTLMAGVLIKLTRILVEVLIRHRAFTESFTAGVIAAILIYQIPWIGPYIWHQAIIVGAVIGLMKEFRNN